jgi:soluble lytic murein transglycosylase-like protein
MRHLILTLGLLVVAVPARAELVFFSTGRSMSVKSHRVEGDSLLLTLRNGGEIICDASIVVRIAPDEVPYPEPDAPSPPPAANVIPAVSAPAPDPAPYGAIIEKAAAEQGVNAKLVRAVIQVESGYQERARSPKGAMGLMQLMPATARQYAVADPYDPVSNIEAGSKHLKALLERFPLALALAAYNAGEAAVERFRGIPPYRETRDYVSRILDLVGR